MVKIKNNTVSYLGFCMDYDEPDFFEELGLWLDDTVSIEVQEIKESFTRNGRKFSGIIKVLLIDDVVVVANLENMSIEQVLMEILEELQIEEEILTLRGN